ncbi:hypothetical protein [Ramlibacter sp. AN1133]|uniref:hypothetical protein n=1 Tax=Ramlibacter sp. AN1133 TaxID=3133429 RepID=UPI0030C35047
MVTWTSLLPKMRIDRKKESGPARRAGAGSLLPLYRTTSSAALVDDDVDFLHSMEMSLPMAWNITCHSHPSTLEKLMERSSALRRKEQQALFSCVDAQVSTDGHPIAWLLRFLATPTRFELVGLVVSDFKMPAVDGVTLLSRYGFPGVQRLLLTGIADNVIAVDAFNGEKIEGFIPKMSADLPQRVEAMMRRHMAKSAEIRGQMLARALTQQVTNVLDDAGAVTAITALLARLQVDEHVILGHPAGILALTLDKRVLWIQLDDQASLTEQASELAAMTDALDASMVKAIGAITAHQATSNHRLLTEVPSLKLVAAPTEIVCKAPWTTAAVFEIDGLPPDLKPRFHADWLATQQGSL